MGAGSWLALTLLILTGGVLMWSLWNMGFVARTTCVGQSEGATEQIDLVRLGGAYLSLYHKTTICSTELVNDLRRISSDPAWSVAPGQVDRQWWAGLGCVLMDVSDGSPPAQSASWCIPGMGWHSEMRVHRVPETGKLWSQVSRTELWVSGWWVVLPLLLFALQAMVRLIRWGRRGVNWVRGRQRRKEGLCCVCGYDLRATPERCPECGTPVTGPHHPRSAST